MFLKHLLIKGDNGIIREILFKKGINFIVDNTPITGGKESGNNVGKTTVLRLIDYCLGSKGKDIYSDGEFSGIQNTELRNFLINSNVEIELTLIDNFDDTRETITVVRNFHSGKLKKYSINGFKTSSSELIQHLNIHLFNNPNNKPSFRSLISKFIRDNSFKMSRTLRCLHQTTTNVQYEAVHLFLFGIHLPENLYEEKQWNSERLTAEEKALSNLTEDFSENALIQMLKIINRDIENLEIEKAKYNLNHTEDGDLKKLNDLKIEIGKVATEISDKEFRISLINESLEELQQGITKTDVEQIRQLYYNAKSFLPNIQTKFEEVVKFHNTMLEKKLHFISNDLEPLQQGLQYLRQRLETILSEEKALAKKLNRILNIGFYDDLIKELNNKYELKGSREERLNQIVYLKHSIAEKRSRLDEINEIMESAEEKLIENEGIFNNYFSSYSSILYGEEYFLTHDKDENNIYKFTINNFDANVGAGKKKGQIAAFDLAYINFCEEVGLKAPHFVLHDSTEDVSINQLLSLAHIAENINGQYIVAILKDKFAGSEEGLELIENNIIIELSQSQKLFRFNDLSDNKKNSFINEIPDKFTGPLSSRAKIYESKFPGSTNVRNTAKSKSNTKSPKKFGNK